MSDKKPFGFEITIWFADENRQVYHEECDDSAEAVTLAVGRLQEKRLRDGNSGYRIVSIGVKLITH